MKTFRHLIIGALVAMTSISSAFGNGILRIPHPHQDDEYMNLSSAQISIEIHDQVAITTVKDVFEITSDHAVDANFHFRLPPEASVTGFGYWRGDEFFPYVIRPGEQGGPGGGAAGNSDLRNYLASNPFNIFIDSIPPGQFAVQLQYAELLSYDFGVVTLSYPLNFGNFIFGNIDSLSIDVAIDSRRQMTEILCTGEHDDQTDIEMANQYSAIAALKSYNIRPREDWNLNIRFNQEDIGGWLYTYRGDSTMAGYFMLVMEPGIVDPDEQVQKFFTFVFDKSGSMAGSKMAQAKSAALGCLNSLISEDYFNIIDFSSNVRTFQRDMVHATGANVNSARNYINALNASGATDIYGALTTAVSQSMGEGSVNQIVFLTDGNPTAGESTDPDAIMEAVSRENEYNARIFCFGIGQDLNAQLLNGLAFQNRGRSYFIDPNVESIDSTVAQFFRYVATPALGNPFVEFGDGLEIDSLAPMELQDLAAGRQIYLFGRYETFGNYEVSLGGRMVSGDTTFAFDAMEFPEWSEDNPFVARMWAKATIDYWIEWLSVNGERGNQEIIDKIIELSIRFGILTKYTEYEEPPNAVEDPAIAMLAATPVNGGIELNWSPIGSSINAVFNVYRADGIESPFLRINDIPLSSTRYIDTTAKLGQNARYRVEMVIDGKSVWSEIVTVGVIPENISLAPAFPNPFNAITSIAYSLVRSTQTELRVYDIAGNLVEELHVGEESAGLHTIIWDAGTTPAGIYVLKLEAEGVMMTQKLVLIK